MAKKKEKDNTIATNRKARHDYEIIDSLECGIMLVGSEVQSVKNHKVSLGESYARVKDNEVWLINCDIAEYKEARVNHAPKRPRKLLLHRREIDKFASKATVKGYTLVPLKMYFVKGRAKILLAVCKGKREYDKRSDLKSRDAKREIRKII
jgi:SsrA-binding protein